MELKTIEKEIEFVIDGINCGSGTIFILADGTIDDTNAVDEFYSTLRKNSKSLIAEAEVEQKEAIVNKLTDAQEDTLKEIHAKDYHETDDDMSDAYESWLEDLSASELASYL